MMPITGRLVQRKAQKNRQDERSENAKLARGAQQREERLGQQGSEIHHCTHADKESAVGRDSVSTPAFLMNRQHPLFCRIHHSGERQVADNAAQANRQQQKRFVFLGNSEIK